MRSVFKRLLCRAFGHPVPWLTTFAGGRYHFFCPRCGTEVG
jgi:hypothetical protein